MLMQSSGIYFVVAETKSIQKIKAFIKINE